MLRPLINWLRHGDAHRRPSDTYVAGSSPEAITLRSIGMLVLAAFITKTLTTAPHPGLSGRSAAVLAAACLLVGAALKGSDGDMASVLVFTALPCHPDVHVIALTTFADDESVLGALRAGARGYLTKDASSEDIHTAIHTVAAGDAALDPAVQHHVVAALASGQEARHDGSVAAPSELPDDLTPREAEVLALIAEGLTNTGIAGRLVVSQTTVKSHINHLFTKAGLRDRTQAANYAYRTGIATPPR